MYAKILNVVGVSTDGYIFECKTLTWEYIEDEEHAVRLMNDAGVGDYGIYENGSKIRLSLLIDDTNILLESGSVYVMNEEGKTIDSIHA